MNVAFHSNQLGIRGTEVALYDYAHYNETLLGNISYIFAPAVSDLSALDKFKSRFGDRVILYNNFEEIQFSSSYRIDAAYLIKAGYYDNILFPHVRNIVHAVFDGSDKHGDVYVAVSEWLGKKYSIDYLPHIVSLPDIQQDFRSHLGIAPTDLVFGRYGGFDQFDIPYLSNVICPLADKGVWFLLMNTKRLSCEHPRIVYIEPTTDLNTKAAFINTCTAMLHGRTEGESFGLSIAEFLHQNKPVVTNIICRDRNHVEILKDKGFYYSDPNELYGILSAFENRKYEVKHLVNPYRAEVVMGKFKSFIDV